MIYSLIFITIYLLIGLEAFTYPGFLSQKLHLNTDFLIIVFCWLLASQKISYRANNYFRYAAFFITLIALILNTLESYYFPNYIFSHFHLNLEAINILTGLLLIVIFINIIKAGNILFLFCLILLFYISSASAVQTISNSLGKTAYVLTHLQETEHDKLVLLWGNVINYFDFINTEVLPNQTIVIPSGRIPFKYTSSGLFVSYFVYPRRVIDTMSSQINFGDWAILTSEESRR